MTTQRIGRFGGNRFIREKRAGHCACGFKSERAWFTKVQGGDVCEPCRRKWREIGRRRAAREQAR